MIQSVSSDNGDDGVTEMPTGRDDASFFGFDQPRLKPVAGNTPGETAVVNLGADAQAAFSGGPPLRWIPAGQWTKVAIAKAELRTPMGGGVQYLHIRFQALMDHTREDGVHVQRGAAATQNLQICHQDPAKRRSAINILAHIARCAGVELDAQQFSPLQLHGACLQIRTETAPHYKNPSQLIPVLKGHRPLPQEDQA